MLLFKREHIDLILRGLKTQTRRSWKKPRVKVGSVHKCKILMLSTDYFAQVRILSVRQERLGDITIEDSIAEGYNSREGYFAEWKRINHSLDLDSEVWVVSFERC